MVLNEKLLDVLGDDVTQDQAFAHANDVLKNAVGGISDIIHMHGLVNVDFEDVKTVMSEPGKAMMGRAQAGGPDRATKAAEAAVACPLLNCRPTAWTRSRSRPSCASRRIERAAAGPWRCARSRQCAAAPDGSCSATVASALAPPGAVWRRR